MVNCWTTAQPLPGILFIIIISCISTAAAAASRSLKQSHSWLDRLQGRLQPLYHAHPVTYLQRTPSLRDYQDYDYVQRIF